MLASARMSPLVLEPAHTTLKSSSNPAAIEELCFPPLQELRAPCQRGQKDRQRVPAAAPQHGQKTQRSAYTTCHHRCSRKTPRTKDAIVRSSKPSQQLGCSPGARLVQEPGAASPARRRQRPRRLPHTNLPNPVPMATKATGVAGSAGPGCWDQQGPTAALAPAGLFACGCRHPQRRWEQAIAGDGKFTGTVSTLAEGNYRASIFSLCYLLRRQALSKQNNLKSQWQT